MRFSAAALAAMLVCAPAWQAQAQSGDRPGEKQDAPKIEAPPAPALSPEAALRTLRVAPGFRVELVASDPLVFDPVAMTIGPDGRMWVVEMRAFMPNVDGTGEDAPIGTIATLEDTDNDGRMDKRTEFANGLILPRAIALVGDGVLVAEPPNLWFMRDTNGDGKMDDKQPIANDYGNPTNPEHSANGLLWGLDNWIYSANHTTRFRYQAGKWRREPTAFRGQWGIAQDDFGQLYFNNNSVALFTDALPAEYLLRNRHLPNPRGANVQMAGSSEISVWPARVNTGVNRGYKILREDGTLPVLTAACGPAIYRGSLFPESFRGDAFIAEPAGNLVKRLIIEQREGEPHVRNAYHQTEFLASTDERFRPVSVYNGPDGSLYVVDMYRGVIQHRIFLTTYLRNQIKERGLEAPLGMGRVYRIVPENAQRRPIPNLSKAKPPQLAKALDHDEAWVRETAQRLLVERHDASVSPALRQLVTSSPRPATRVHALWTLDGVDAIDWSTAAAALRDAEPRVAATGVRVAERFLKTEPERTVTAMLERARWNEPAVVRQVALSLGSAPAKHADPALLEIAQQAGSLPYVADAIVSSLAGREFAFAATLMASDATNDIAMMAPVLAVATATVLHSGNAEQTQALLNRLNDSKTQPWVHAALLDGVDRLIPRASDGSRRMAFLAAEPRALQAYASSNAADASRAALLLKSLRWRGATVDAAASLAKLTPEQRQQYERGRIAFAVCAACHQDEGQGMAGLAPALAGSQWVNGSPQALVRIVLNGKVDQLAMPGLGGSLDDATVAAILTYVRRSWGNEASPIDADTVKSIRDVVSHRDEPWSDEELQPLR
ncbi:c-type cytochrome [Steroidobacter sp. S1-65]|uniref:C-type cytochrome n=1 Tax=Steroidobacter gossypii TaxID=2805490 RepID=A0ABS1X174_9GAMM|nr:c-type cytochrome [Steroidobacter gossypii]MBM0106968.1 c-type cytochrome [Steroidobacter gossypii]